MLTHFGNGGPIPSEASHLCQLKGKRKRNAALFKRQVPGHWDCHSLATGPGNQGAALPYGACDTLQGLVFPGLASGATLLVPGPSRCVLGR